MSAPMFNICIVYDANEPVSRQNIATVCKLFHGDDNVSISVLLSTDDANQISDVSKKIEELPCNFQNKIEMRILVDTDENDHLDQFNIVLKNAPITDEDLFGHYKKAMTDQFIPAYESDNVVDNYDASKIRQRRLSDPNWVGSTDLNLFKNYIQWVSERLSESDKNIRILDMGCGAGAFYFLMQKYFSADEMARISYQGVDLSRSQAMRARTLFPDAQFDYGHAYTYAFGDRHYDLIIMNSVLPFNPPHIQLKIIESMSKLCDGSLFFSVCTQANQLGYPIPEKIFSNVSNYTKTKQFEYTVNMIQFESLMKRLGFHNNLVVEDFLIFIGHDNSSCTFRSDHPEYGEIHKFISSAPHRPPVGQSIDMYSNQGAGLPASINGVGAGNFYESHLIHVQPNGFVSQVEENNTSEDLNLLYDKA